MELTNIKLFLGKKIIFLSIILLISCKKSNVENIPNMEHILECFIDFYDIEKGSKILIQVDIENKDTYKILLFNLTEFNPPQNYLGKITFKTIYNDNVVFYSSSYSEILIPNQLKWDKYQIKNKNNTKENIMFFDFQELMLLYNKKSDSLFINSSLPHDCIVW